MLNGTSTTWNGLLPVAEADVPTPATGRVLFHDSADGLLKSKDSAGVVANLEYDAPDTTVIVQRGTTDILSADNCRTAYASAEALLPGGHALSKYNRAAILVPAGRYDFGTGDGSNHGLELDTQFIDIIGMTGVPEDVIFTSQIATAGRGTVEQTADDVIVKGINIDINQSTYVNTYNEEPPAAYYPSSNLQNTILKDVICSSQDEDHGLSMRRDIEYSGKYIKVDCGIFGLGGGLQGIASGGFWECTGTDYCYGGTASGYFWKCIGRDHCYGRISSGDFPDCVGRDYCYGGFNGVASGTFPRSVGRNNCFGADVIPV